MSQELLEWWFRVILPGFLLMAVFLLWGIVAHFILRNAEVKVLYARGRMRCPGCGGARLSHVDLARVLCPGCGTVSDMHRAVEAAEEER